MKVFPPISPSPASGVPMWDVSMSARAMPECETERMSASNPLLPNVIRRPLLTLTNLFMALPQGLAGVPDLEVEPSHEEPALAPVVGRLDVVGLVGRGDFDVLGPHRSRVAREAGAQCVGDGVPLAARPGDD